MLMGAVPVVVGVPREVVQRHDELHDSVHPGGDEFHHAAEPALERPRAVDPREVGQQRFGVHGLGDGGPQERALVREDTEKGALRNPGRLGQFAGGDVGAALAE